MAVKARETLESRELSLPVIGFLFLVIIGYTFLYNRVISQLDDYQLKTIIGVISLAIMFGAFIFSLRYMTTSFMMTLTHDRLNIERKVLFIKKNVADLMLSQVLDIVPLEKAKKTGHNMRNFTLLDVKGKKKYVLRYQQEETIYAIKIQCSGKFYESLRKQSKIASFDK